MKELVDNALDAAETAGQQTPEVVVTDGADGVTVTDNGNGFAPEVVAGTLDFSGKVSDKLRYRTPTRGAQGNALKTVLGFAYNAGKGEPLVVESRGVRHSIVPDVDAAGAVQIAHEQARCERTEGTEVFVPYPQTDEEDTAELSDLVRHFSLFNPHARLTYRGTEEFTVGPHSEGYKKPSPGDKGCPHWYGQEDFAGLLGALQINYPDMPLSEFTGLFRGGSGKGQMVRAAVDGARVLGEVSLDGHAEVLWRTLRENVRPATVGALGPLKGHLPTAMQALYPVDAETVKHKFVKGEFEHEGTEVPFGLDVAFGFCEEEAPATDVVFGINNSPCYRNPYRTRSADYAGSWPFYKATARHVWSAYQYSDFISQFCIDTESPYYVVAVHLVCPNLRFQSYDKADLDTKPFIPALTEATYHACKAWDKATRSRVWRENRERGYSVGRGSYYDRSLTRSKGESLKDIVFDVLGEAVERAEGGEG